MGSSRPQRNDRNVGATYSRDATGERDITAHAADLTTRTFAPSINSNGGMHCLLGVNRLNGVNGGNGASGVDRGGPAVVAGIGGNSANKSHQQHPMFHLQFLSDAHLHTGKLYCKFKITPAAPVLALLGNIGMVEEHLQPFLQFLVNHLYLFQAILYVPGDHDTLFSNWERTLGYLYSFKREVQDRRRKDANLGEFVLLHRRLYRPPWHPSVALVGCTLFSQVPTEEKAKVSKTLVPFRHTGDWNMDAHNSSHADDLDWLNDMVHDLGFDSTVRDIGILTHWSPTTSELAISSQLNAGHFPSALATDLSRELCYCHDKVKVWAFGHTHQNCDFYAPRPLPAGPLRLVSNQMVLWFDPLLRFDLAKTIMFTG